MWVIPDIPEQVERVVYLQHAERWSCGDYWQHNVIEGVQIPDPESERFEGG